MTGKFRCYSSYTEQQTDWFANIPSHWTLKRLKHIAQVNPSRGRFQKYESVTFLPMEAVSESGTYEVSRIGKREDFSDSLTDFKKGDVILAKITPCFENGKGAYLEDLPTDKGVGSTEFHVFRADRRLVSPRFLYYLVSNQDFRSYAQTFMVGSAGQKRITTPFIANTQFPIPTIPEQDRIVAFLDEKTAAIDDAIAKKRRLIELLQEQKGILINTAVTQGLDPTVPIKESGVEWIGRIPAHWNVLPLTKYLESIVDYRGRTPTKVEFGVFLVTARNIKEGMIDYEVSQEFIAAHEYKVIMSRGKPQIGDILFTTEAPLGSVALVDRDDIALAQRIIKFRVKKEHLDPKFVKFSIMSAYFQTHIASEATGSTALGIKASKLHKLRLIAPPLHEQKEIVTALEDWLNQIDRAIEFANKEISLLFELKNVYIAEAVTGKIKV